MVLTQLEEASASPANGSATDSLLESALQSAAGHRAAVEEGQLKVQGLIEHGWDAVVGKDSTTLSWGAVEMRLHQALDSRMSRLEAQIAGQRLAGARVPPLPLPQAPSSCAKHAWRTAWSVAIVAL